MAIDEQIYLHASLYDRFAAAASLDDESVAQRLQLLIDGEHSLIQQRDDAWGLLTAGVEWAARALRAAGIAVPPTPVEDSEVAFAWAQQLEQRLFDLSQLRDRSHDQEALIVDAVKRACYAGAELGPVPGGRLAVPGTVVTTISPSEVDLQEIGSDLGEAVRRLARLGLADVATEAGKALTAARSPVA